MPSGRHEGFRTGWAAPPPKATNLRFGVATDGKAALHVASDGVVLDLPNPHDPAGPGPLSEAQMKDVVGGNLMNYQKGSLTPLGKAAAWIQSVSGPGE